VSASNKPDWDYAIVIALLVVFGLLAIL